MSNKKNESTLGIVGMILSFIICFPLFPIIGLILCIIAISRRETKSVCGIIGIVISGLYILLAILVIVYSYSTANNLENADKESNIVEYSTEQVDEEDVEEEIVYIKSTVDDMMDSLDSNALRAEQQYLDKYVEVTGRLSVIDSDGKYITLNSINKEFELTGVQCYIKNTEQKDQIINMSRDDIITVRIKCDTIGEILGYSGDIIEIVN